MARSSSGMARRRGSCSSRRGREAADAAGLRVPLVLLLLMELVLLRSSKCQSRGRLLLHAQRSGAHRRGGTRGSRSSSSVGGSRGGRGNEGREGGRVLHRRGSRSSRRGGGR